MATDDDSEHLQLATSTYPKQQMSFFFYFASFFHFWCLLVGTAV